ncbi:MAG: tetratricopeptide repeat protein [Candidatus Krumholzibacteriota bacterium]|nr:tetratricopeptide repeat protein [Candidatus Krumholzibacteriota bacterium]
MKRSILLSIILAVAFTSAAATKEKSPYAKYVEDKTAVNFVAAYNNYEMERADTVNNMATIFLAYLHMSEMNRNLDMLKENIGSLSGKHKFNYANILLSLGRYDDAIEIYKQLNMETPKWSCPWRHRGEAHWKNGEYEEAVASLEKAIETRETHYDAYTQLAQVLTDMKEYKRALEVLEKGFTYYGKDIEDPEEEVNMLDINFLYLTLLRENGRIEDADILKARLEKLSPGDERLSQ